MRQKGCVCCNVDQLWTSLIEIVNVLDLVSQVHNVVLINVYLDLGNSGGLGFWNEGYMSQGREMGS